MYAPHRASAQVIARLSKCFFHPDREIVLTGDHRSVCGPSRPKAHVQQVASTCVSRFVRSNGGTPHASQGRLASRQVAGPYLDEGGDTVLRTIASGVDLLRHPQDTLMQFAIRFFAFQGVPRWLVVRGYRYQGPSIRWLTNCTMRCALDEPQYQRRSMRWDVRNGC